MFHATLIIGGSEVDRLDLAESLTKMSLAPAPDVLIVNEEPSIGIRQIKTVERFLSRRPLKIPNKICFLPQAEKMTLAAQNAFLKTLEEPPAHSRIILTAPTSSSFLTTIVSRCQVIKVARKTDSATSSKEQKDLYEQIVNAPVGDRIELARQQAGSPETAREFCLNQLTYLKTLLASQPHHQSTIKRLLLTLDYLKANVNPKLCLEQLLLHYPPSQKE